MSKRVLGVCLSIACSIGFCISPTQAATLRPFTLVVTRQAGGLASLVVEATSEQHAIAQARALPGVVAAEAQVIYQAATTPNDPDFSQQTALQSLQATSAWDTRTSASSIVVAVLDSGVDIDNPDLSSNIWTNSKELAGNGVDDDANGYVDDVHGWSFIENTNDPKPRLSPGATVAGLHHGTVVAGIVGARGNNALAGTGVVWDARVLPIRVLDSTGSGTTITVAQGVRYAIAAGADIINLSFVGEGTSATLQAALEEAYAAGVLVVAAAGNEGVNLTTSPRYPVCYAHVLGVASVSASGTRSTFSNYGSCVDITAPGENIYSTFFYSPAEGYTQLSGAGWSGTSVASPFVAGAAALVWAENPDMHVDALQTLLTDSAESLTATDPTFAAALGAGVLRLGNVFSAVQTAQQAKANILTLPRYGDTPRVREYTFTGSAARQFISSTTKTRADGFTSAGNVLGDSDDEIITSFGSGVEPRVRVYTRQGKVLRTFLAYPLAYRGGVVHATGDLDGDGTDEIVVGTATGSAHIRVFSGSGTVLRQFFAFPKNYTGGVRIALADVTGDGKIDIVVSKYARDPRVAIFSGTGQLVRSFRVFPTNITTGVNVAAGPLTADGSARIVVGLATGSPRVRVFTFVGSLVREFTAYRKELRGGVSVAVGDINGDGVGDIVTGTGPGAAPEVRIFGNEGRTRLKTFNAYAAQSRTGITVSVIPRL